MPRAIRIDIAANGRGTVIDKDTGEALENVRAITIRAEVGCATKVTLELIAVEVGGDVAVLDDEPVVTRISPS